MLTTRWLSLTVFVVAAIGWCGCLLFIGAIESKTRAQNHGITVYPVLTAIDPSSNVDEGVGIVHACVIWQSWLALIAGTAICIHLVVLNYSLNASKKVSGTNGTAGC